MKKKSTYNRKPWEGVARKEDEGKEQIAPCGCVFRAEPYYWGSNIKKIVNGRLVKPRPSGYFWFRVKDCPKIKELDRCIT